MITNNIKKRCNFISPSPAQRVSQKKIYCTVAVLLFFGMCFFTSCTERMGQNDIVQIPQEEKIWMDKFFQDFFLESPVIYTLFGSKPMSTMTIVSASQEEWINSLRQHWQNLQEPARSHVLDEIRDHARTYLLHIHWEKWINWHHMHRQNNFLFLTQSSDSEHLFNVFVINVEEVIKSLKEHYSLFASRLKMEFEPREVTLDFENSASPFWKQVFSDPLLEGILFGYGEQNATLFSEEFKVDNEDKKQHFPKSCISSDLDKETDEKEKISLPLFRSYPACDGEDCVVVKYQAERKNIQRRLRNKDRFQEVMKKLYPQD